MPVNPVSRPTIQSLTRRLENIDSEKNLPQDKLSALREEIFAAISERVRAGQAKGLVSFWHTVERSPALKAALAKGGLQEVRRHPVSERVEIFVERESAISQSLPDHFGKEAYLQGGPQVRVR